MVKIFFIYSAVRWIVFLSLFNIERAGWKKLLRSKIRKLWSEKSGRLCCYLLELCDNDCVSSLETSTASLHREWSHLMGTEWLTVSMLVESGSCAVHEKIGTGAGHSAPHACSTIQYNHGSSDSQVLWQFHAAFNSLTITKCNSTSVLNARIPECPLPKCHPYTEG